MPGKVRIVTDSSAQSTDPAVVTRDNITIVLASQTTSVGLAMLVEAAARFAEEYTSVDDVVRAVRKLIPRVYGVFYVETLDYLRRAGLITESQAILGTMLGIKPFLTIEE